MHVTEEDIAAVKEAYLLVLGREADDVGLQAYAEIISQNEKGLQDLYITLLKSDEFSRRVATNRFPYDVGGDAEERMRYFVSAIYRYFLRRDIDHDGSESHIVPAILDRKMDIRAFITITLESEEFRLLTQHRALEQASDLAFKTQAFTYLENTLNPGEIETVDQRYSKETISRIKHEFAPLIIEFSSKKAAESSFTMEYE